MHKTFLSCDWGTSSFRLRLIDIISGQIIAASSSDEGIASVYASWKKEGSNEKERISFYLAIIQKHVSKIEEDIAGNTDNVPIILSGMASSSIGMIELPYKLLPFSLGGEDIQYKRIENHNNFPRDLMIISGASTGKDVMRGEETQLIGCAAETAAGQKVYVFPGTHSKHITTSEGSAVDTATYMTGEFFELLSKKSILSASITAGGDIEKTENKTAFETGVKDSLQQNLLHNSFMVRTNQLLNRSSGEGNYFYLSGLLIGSELNQLTKKEMEEIIIVGDKKIVLNYLLAFQVLCIECKITTADAERATIQGQLVIYHRLSGL